MNNGKRKRALKAATIIMALVTAVVFFSPLAFPFWPLALSSFATCFLMFLTVKQDGDEGHVFLFTVFSMILACALWVLKFAYLLLMLSNGL